MRDVWFFGFNFLAFNLSDFDIIVVQTSSILMLSGDVFGSGTSDSNTPGVVL